MAPSQLVDHSPRHPEASPPIPTAFNVIIIDNYDSFTWNIYQYLVLAGAIVYVFRNDEITLDALIAKKPSHIVVSPGPGHPTTDSGISRDVIRHFAGLCPIFGVCMGMQCIFDVYGGEVASAGEWLHGKTSPLAHDGKGIYAGLDQKIDVTRYHSLAGTHVTLPEPLEVSSWVDTLDGSGKIIQGVRHKEFVVEGVQYHPESILTKGGLVMIKNFLRMRGGTWVENERLQKESSTQTTDAAEPSSSPKPKKTNILQTIYADRKRAVDAQKQIPSLRMADLQAAYDLKVAPPLVPFATRLKQSPFNTSLMAEFKRASPSKGMFAMDTRAAEQAHQYALAGASTISVLTEPTWFKGSIDDLRAVRSVLNGMPNRPAILRKEFIFDEYQILEARLAGADTVLLIVKMLDDELLTQLYNYSLSLGMEPLVEVQTADEMTRAVNLGAKVIGVNNRNLETFEVDTKTTSRLRSMVKTGTIIAALSGISSYSDVQECQKDGINAILVGESIMRAPDPYVFISELCSGEKPPAKDTTPKKLAVKICGTRSPEAAKQALESGADLVGMILVPGSKRCVSPETARAISKAVHEHAQGKTPQIRPAVQPASATNFFESSAAILDDSVPKIVGVFRNQPLNDVLRMQKEYSLDIVQLHGDEPLEWANIIPCPVIRSFQPGKPGLGQSGYHHVCLLDSGAGSGQLLDVSSVKEVLKADPGLRIILAGGLDPNNVGEAVKALGEYGSQVVGVDVSSGVEEDGQQSLKAIDAFVLAAKEIR